MKILYLPINTNEIIQTGMYDAFTNLKINFEVFDFFKMYLNRVTVSNIRSALIEKALKFLPDYIHMQLQFTNIIDANTVKSIKKHIPHVIISNWTGDIRNYVPREFVEISNVVDYSLISSVGQIELYKGAGCKNIKYWQIGYNPKIHFPKYKNSFEFYVSFIAAHYKTTENFPGTQIRLEAAYKLREKFGTKFGLFGPNYPPGLKSSGFIRQSQVNDIYNNSACVLSINNFNNVNYYFSDRLLHCLASGRPTISYYFPGINDYFVHNRDVLIASNICDIVNYVESCNNKDSANSIGNNGYKRVNAEHTYTSRVLELINILSGNE